ncbi:uncharacterized protein METZ01_LOCUS12343 [marine metagenome]|uniref:C1q domain-containing protein n=1 Tax=marine metagenome TaxID=408172 RepID=A0A381NZ80_9ZZZZ
MLEDAGASGQVLTSDGTNWTSADAAAPLPAVGPDGNVLTSDGTNWASEESAGGGDSVFPFYKTDGTSDNITITSGQFPFYKADGTLDNIAAPGGGEGLSIGIPLSSVAGDTLYHDGSVYARLPKGTAAQVLSMNSGATAPEWAAPAPGATNDIFMYEYQLANNTDGPTYAGSGGFQTILLNTEHKDTASTGSLASNRMTLPAGTYTFNSMVNMGRSDGAYGRGLILRLWNVTANASVGRGTAFCGGANALGNELSMHGQFTIASSAEFELQGYNAYIGTIYGYKASTGNGYENYASILFRRYA